jgi:hypothetical protein
LGYLVPLSSHAKRLTIRPATCHPPTHARPSASTRDPGECNGVFENEKCRVAFLVSVKLVVTCVNNRVGVDKGVLLVSSADELTT